MDASLIGILAFSHFGRNRTNFPEMLQASYSALMPAALMIGQYLSP
jgi:hypothetical protein